MTESNLTVFLFFDWCNWETLQREMESISEIVFALQMVYSQYQKFPYTLKCNITTKR